MQRVISIIILIFGSLYITACSFVQDRSQESVQIIDATDAKRTTSEVAEDKKPTSLPPKKYRVESGDTLGIIAQKTLGSASLYRELADFNQMDVNQSLTVGQLILIPSSQQIAKIPATRVTPIARPKTASSNKATNIDLRDMDQLIADKQYNQAIDWAISNPQLGENLELQDKLVLATKNQVNIERSEKDYSEADFLIQGLLQTNSFSRSNQNQLQQLSKQVTCEQASHNALFMISDNKIEQAYQELNRSYQLDSVYSETLDDFVQARAAVTESMHQDALKLYRNQQLKPALDIWNNILIIKPNDDLALVYKDRVNNLQKKLDNL